MKIGKLGSMEFLFWVSFWVYLGFVLRCFVSVVRAALEICDTVTAYRFRGNYAKCVNDLVQKYCSHI